MKDRQNKPLTSMLLLGTLLSVSGPPTLVHSDFKKVCDRILSKASFKLGLRPSPIELRAHRLLVDQKISEFLEPESNPQQSWRSRWKEAQKKYLVHLGYDSNLVDRWSQMDSIFWRKIIYSPNNQPTTYYRTIRVPVEKFRLNRTTSFLQIFLAWNEQQLRDVRDSIGIDNRPGVLIYQKLQIPKFASAYSFSELHLPQVGPGAKTPPLYPTVDSEFTRNAGDICTHLKFPELSGYESQWFPVAEVLNEDGTLDLSQDFFQKDHQPWKKGETNSFERLKEGGPGWLVLPEDASLHSQAEIFLKELTEVVPAGWLVSSDRRFHNPFIFEEFNIPGNDLRIALTDRSTEDREPKEIEKIHSKIEELLDTPTSIQIYRIGLIGKERLARDLNVDKNKIRYDAIEIRWTDGSVPGRRVDDEDHQDGTWATLVYGSNRGPIIITLQGKTRTPGGRLVAFNGTKSKGIAPKHYSPEFIPDESRLSVSWLYSLDD